MTTLATSASPQNAGSSVIFSASVNSASGGSTPTGTVTFTVDGTNAATTSLDSSGRAAYTTITLAAGTHTITAAYSGDANYTSSSASLTQSIVGAVIVTFSTSPAGLSYSVDGTPYTGVQSLPLVDGSTHTVSVGSPQTSPGTRYTFNSWSDGGAQTHTITASAGGSYGVSFNVAYLLTTAASPAASGTVSPASGSYYPAFTSVGLIAAANAGYAFSSWTGNVTNAVSASTTVVMNAPQSVTASFAPFGTSALFGGITAKAGPANARVWTVQVGNSGPATAIGAQVASVGILQTGGPACAPVVTSPLPASAGDLASGAVASITITLDFTGCAAIARFTVTVSLSANGGGSTATVTRLNQFR